jgi:hypothetical protein
MAAAPTRGSAGPGAVVEDAIELPPHEGSVHEVAQGPERQLVVDHVPDLRDAGVKLEMVLVAPAAVGALELSRRRNGARLPHLDASAPA